MKPIIYKNDIIIDFNRTKLIFSIETKEYKILSRNCNLNNLEYSKLTDEYNLFVDEYSESYYQAKDVATYLSSLEDVTQFSCEFISKLIGIENEYE